MFHSFLKQILLHCAMDKKPTDFSQVSLLSNQKAKLIVLKNSIQNNEHVKLCKSLELAKREIKADHGKKKKDFEKRLERHVQDFLSTDDIKSLHKYVGGVRNERDFCSHFKSGGKRSSSFSHDRKQNPSASDLSNLETRSCTDGEDRWREMGLVPNERSKTKTYRMPQWEESHFNSFSFGKSDEVYHNNHSRACPETITDVQSTNRSPKVQQNTFPNKQNLSEMVFNLNLNSEKPNTASLKPKDELIDKSREKVDAEGNACNRNADQNNSLPFEEGVSVGSKKRLQSGISYNLDTKVSKTKVDNNQNNSEGSSVSNGCGLNPLDKANGKQGQYSKKRVVIRKKLGPPPKECDEETSEETLQVEYNMQGQNTLKQRDSFIQANYDRTTMEKHREVFPTGVHDQTRRRRSSWAGRTTTEQLLMQSDLNELFPHFSRTSDPGNGLTRTSLDNWNKETSLQKPSEIEAIVSECAIIAGEYLMTERGKDCENFDDFQEVKKSESCLQKSNSFPLGLVTQQRTKMYSEEPFYIRPRRLTRRISWQSSKMTETLKGLQEIADKVKSDNELMTEEPETPLVHILPPITLQSIYAQQTSKEKKEQEQERKQKGGKKLYERKSIDSSLLKERLKDCRYLRLRKASN